MKKEENNKRKKTGILAVLLLLLVVVTVSYTYSMYKGFGTVESKARIAKWAVKIGENDLSSYASTPLSAELTLSDNEYVADNVIAPGRSGTYTVEIDPTGSQVAIDYIIKVSGIEGIENEKIKVTGARYWIGEVTGEGTAAAEATGTDGVTISQSLADVLANKKLTVEVTIEWLNVDTNDEVDTNNGKEAGEITVNTSITAKQHIAS